MDSSKRFGSRRVRSIFACALAASAAVCATAGAALPDLVSDAPERPYLQQYLDGSGTRLLLRFDSFVHNQGPGALEVRFPIGAAPGNVRTGPLVQHEHDDAGGGPGRDAAATSLDSWPMTGADAVWEDTVETNADGHDHWHLQRASAYELVARDDHAQRVAPAEKVGFCLMDSTPIDAGRPGFAVATQRYGGFGLLGNTCRRGGPSQPAEIVMGVSAGWRDLYAHTLAHQWVDVSDVGPGTYVLQARVDPEDVVTELHEDNNDPRGIDVLIPGHLAQPRVAERIVKLAATPVAPASGELAAPRYRIDVAPVHGTVDRPVGAWFDDPYVTYTPSDPAGVQEDELEYTARASDNAFPRSPPRATVKFGAGEHVAIAGAPAEIVAGTSVQLTAAAPGPVAWEATGGVVTADGRFTAPTTSDVDVSVRAAVASGAADTVTLRVVAPPASAPAPLPHEAAPGASAQPAGQQLVVTPPTVLPRRAIVAMDAERSGRFVVATVKVGRPGTVRIALRRGERTVASCRTKAAANRTVTCRLRRPTSGTGALRVVVQVGRLGRSVPIRKSHVH